MGVDTIERRERAHPPPHQRRKLPKLEHVALNSASETGAKMDQNAQICKLNFKNFLVAMPPDPIPGRGYNAPPQAPPVGAPVLRSYRASFGAFGPSIVPNQKSWMHPWVHHPLKILATPMRFVHLRQAYGALKAAYYCYYLVDIHEI